MKTRVKIIIIVAVCFFCFENNIFGQEKSKIQLQIGLLSNVTWLEGENRLSSVGFTKNWHGLSPSVGISYQLSKQRFISADVHLQSFSSDYKIPSTDIIGRPIVLPYRNVSLIVPFSVRMNYIPIEKFRTSFNFGGFVAHTIESTCRSTRTERYDIPILAPNYGEFTLDEWNYGMVFGVTQPLYSWSLSSIDLGISYALGLSNMNRDKTRMTALQTNVIGVSLVWNCNTAKRK